MKQSTVLFTLLLSNTASAQNFWIPAERFDEHSTIGLEGTFTTDATYDDKAIYLLASGDQVRIQVGVDANLDQFLDDHPVFEVCAFVASQDAADLNTVRAKHPDPTKSQKHTIDDSYRMWCSRQAPIDEDNLLAGGLKVIAPTDGLVKVRGVSFRSVEGPEPEGDLLADYEYSRALGYLWGDGGISTDGAFLTFRKTPWATSKHFGSVAESFFGDGLTTNSQDSRYKLQLDGTTPADFLEFGESVPDPRAFLTSVVETEGGVGAGRLMDDPSRERCGFLKALVDDLNPECAADTCVDHTCETPNCAFIANGRKRNRPESAGANCGVYLSGTSSDWQELFSGDFHFVKTDRTPGGEPVQHAWDSRPAYTE